MGILNKLLFWRRDDEFDFDTLADQHAKTELKDDPFGLNQPPEHDLEPPAFTQQSATKAQGSPYKQTNFQPTTLSSPNKNVEKDLELISSKLDTIKAMLSSLDQRTANLERAAGVQQQRRERLW